MATFLADTSAWAWARRKGAPPELGAEFSAMLTSGEIATCGVVMWELLHSTNNLEEFRSLRDGLLALDNCPSHDADHASALDVCEGLDERHGGSHHRMVKLPDSLIAAAARSAGLILLHYDADFDRIASVTGQPTQWLRPKGSL